MQLKNKEKPQKQLVLKAEKALKEAVAKAIEEHRLTGDPIVVWKNGKVVQIPSEQLCARETGPAYAVKKGKKTR
jgi:hypothetical protein